MFIHIYKLYYISYIKKNNIHDATCIYYIDQRIYVLHAFAEQQNATCTQTTLVVSKYIIMNVHDENIRN